LGEPQAQAVLSDRVALALTLSLLLDGTLLIMTLAAAIAALLRAHWTTLTLRARGFALGAARRAHWTTLTLRARGFALGAARRAHAADVEEITRRVRAEAERRPGDDEPPPHGG
jgi:hypothetical protein